MDGLITPLMIAMARSMKLTASMKILSPMSSHMDYSSYARYHKESGTSLMFTRDQGYHSSGWWKNPQYERCYHLSVAFRDPETGEFAPFNNRLASAWVQLFFEQHVRLLWVETPYSEQGKLQGVHHYRLFVQPDWVTPFLPLGEVYSKEFTDRDWKSYSEIHGHPYDGRMRCGHDLRSFRLFENGCTCLECHNEHLKDEI